MLLLTCRCKALITLIKPGSQLSTGTANNNNVSPSAKQQPAAIAPLKISSDNKSLENIKPANNVPGENKTAVVASTVNNNDDKKVVVASSENKNETQVNSVVVKQKENVSNENKAANIETSNSNKVKDSATNNLSRQVVKTADSNAMSNNTQTPPAKKSGDNEIHFGAFYNYNSTWIVNQNDYGKFDGKELAYKYTFGSAYGIMGGYDWGRKHGIQAAIIFHSTQGEKYHDTFVKYGTVDREVDLQYFHIPVVYKYKVPLNKKENPIILNFITGLQFGVLSKASEHVNYLGTDSTKDIADHFHKSEIGFVLNIESNFYLNKFLYLTIGLNSSISSNISKKEYFQYADHLGGRSFNLLAGVMIGLNYYIKTK